MLKKQIMTITVVMMTAFFLISGCGPKADPAMVEKVNSFFGAQSNDTYKGGKTYSPVKPAVGQFVIHGNTEKNGKRSVNRTAIVGREAGGWILETYTVDEYSESWVHSKVPVNGMVKSITDGGKITSVLLDFGSSGVKACF